MTPEEHFPKTYRAGRSAFLEAAAAAGLSTMTRVHPQAVGRDGRPLFLDTVSIGRRDARTALLMIAGTHGVEGYFGSGVLTGLLREGLVLTPPQDAKIVLLHALNPYGFSWDRRVDENNVDVNRNFVDFVCPPENLAYEALAECLLLADLSPTAEAAADAVLTSVEPEVVQSAVALGQYRHPDGLIYGGATASWSQRMLLDILKEELKSVETLTVVDFHTGLGACGVGTLLSDDPPDSLSFRRAQTIWREVVSCLDEKAISPPTGGTVGSGLAVLRPGTLSIVLEVGTAPLGEIFRTLRRDNWLYRAGEIGLGAGERIAAEMRTAFFPNAVSWKRQAWAAACGCVGEALKALS